MTGFLFTAVQGGKGLGGGLHCRILLIDLADTVQPEEAEQRRGQGRDGNHQECLGESAAEGLERELAGADPGTPCGMLLSAMGPPASAMPIAGSSWSGARPEVCSEPISLAARGGQARWRRPAPGPGRNRGRGSRLVVALAMPVSCLRHRVHRDRSHRAERERKAQADQQGRQHEAAHVRGRSRRCRRRAVATAHGHEADGHQPARRDLRLSR